MSTGRGVLCSARKRLSPRSSVVGGSAQPRRMAGGMTPGGHINLTQRSGTRVLELPDTALKDALQASCFVVRLVG